MSSPDRETVERLLAELDRVEPVSYDLGTPQVPESEAVRQLVDLGPPVVPLLLDELGEPGASTRRLAGLAAVLDRIGDPRSLPALRDLRERIQRRDTKDEWDYAVIGQATSAIESLTKTEAGKADQV
jgi:hypothetical protein